MKWRQLALANAVVLVALAAVLGWTSPVFLGVVAVNCFLALLLATVLTFPSVVARLDQGSESPPGEMWKARNDVRTALLQGFGSMLLLAGAGVAFSQLRTSQRELQTSAQGQQTERFSRAVEQLATTTSRGVQMGGIFTLEQLARQDKDQRTVVARILAAYVQENASRGTDAAPVTDDGPTPLTLTRPDLQACLDFLATQSSDDGLLSGLLLDRVALQGVTFGEGRARLEGARLRGADLSGASIRGGRLSGADLTDVVLGKADLRKADLSDARLTRARMAESDLTKARLDRADLTGANLRGANFSGASLKGAILVGADLSSASHLDGDLTGADLRHADLRAADLRFADGLLDADLTDARCDPDRTLLPASVRCEKGLVFVVAR